MSNVITQNTYLGIVALREILFDEVTYNKYAQGKGNTGSPSKALRRYGFKAKGKNKLLKEVTIYLNTVEVI